MQTAHAPIIACYGRWHSVTCGPDRLLSLFTLPVLSLHPSENACERERLGDVQVIAKECEDISPTTKLFKKRPKTNNQTKNKNHESKKCSIKTQTKLMYSLAMTKQINKKKRLSVRKLLIMNLVF